MNLRDGVVGVRNKLGEGKPWLFDTNDIIRDLNLSARSMTSAAQALRSVYPGVTSLDPQAGPGVYHQEYPMPADCEFPYEGKIQVGTLLPLPFRQQNQMQLFGFSGGAPRAAYLRRGIILTQQVPGGGEILEAPNPQMGVSTWLVGLWPVPGGVYKFFIEYVQYHPQMSQPMDMVLLPDTAEFMTPWMAYATARGKEKEGDIVSAQYFDGIHEAGKIRYRDYLQSINTLVTPPMYGGGSDNDRGPFAGIMAPTASDLSIE